MAGSQTWLAQPNLMRDFAILVLFVSVFVLSWMRFNILPTPSLSMSDISYWNASVDSTQKSLEVLKSSQRAIASDLKQAMKTTDFSLERIDHLEKTTSAFEKQLQHQNNRTSKLEDKLQFLGKASKFSSKHLQNLWFRPLQNGSRLAYADQRTYAFMSEVEGRGKLRGSPEFFYLPSNISLARLLCIKGNSTSKGTDNLYAYAHKESLPDDAILLPGVTLISNTFWGFNNPWHSMYNLIQFVYWKLDHSCASANQLLLYHLGELRVTMGSWITNIYKSMGLPSTPESLSYGGRPVCFEKAVVSRIGIGGVPSEILRDIYAEVRCKSRQYCNFTSWKDSSSEANGIQVTLMVRGGDRSFNDLVAWQTVVNMECEKVPGCRWVTMHVANLTFCEQVEIMSDTDVLISVHGAQMTNMIFMNPGGRILEMFPKGWLEMAGHGQYIYRNLARWVGLKHEGDWRDPETPDCPNPLDTKRCFSFYKKQNVGVNVTHHSIWLNSVIADLLMVRGDPLDSSLNIHNTFTCKC